MRDKNLSKILAALFAISVIGVPLYAIAQQTTEQFIPMGMSPGVSNTHSYLGNIASVNRSAKTFQMQSDQGLKTMRVSPSTRIWLDRSKVGKSNIKGSINDLEAGSSVEVMHSSEDANTAAWIKIESS